MDNGRGLVCRECGSEMREVFRWRQNGLLFIWSECSGDGCRGQYLRRIPTEEPLFEVEALPVMSGPVLI